jgi:uncharacterized membrane-anchored protein YitT (DUF2179 family)
VEQKSSLSLKHFLLINVGILMMAAGIYFFKAPNGFATGGVSGIAIILAKLPFSAKVGLTQSIYMLVINVVLLVLGVIILGKKCGILTIYCSLMLSFENLILELTLPIEKLSDMATLTSQPLLELVYAVLLTGIGSALLFRYKASSGGTDIVALILKKYTNLNVSQALLLSDFFIAFSTFFVYGSATVGLYAMLGLFAKVFVIDDILDSMNMCKAFTIITTKPDEIDDFILNDLKHSATMYKGEGIYTHEDKQIIITVCKRSEALRLRRKVKEIDPGAFIIITKTSEIAGKGFRDSQ